MSVILDATTHTVRTSRNLRGLLDHARRVSKRNNDGITAGAVRNVEVEVFSLGRSAHLTVEYIDGSTGNATFNDPYIARQWGLRLANRYGAEFCYIDRR